MVSKVYMWTEYRESTSILGCTVADFLKAEPAKVTGDGCRVLIV